MLITLRRKKGGGVQEEHGDPWDPLVLLPRREAACQLLGTPSSVRQVLIGENQGHPQASVQELKVGPSGPAIKLLVRELG